MERPIEDGVDGWSRLESGKVEAAVAWWKDGGWTGRGSYMGTNKEVFVAEFLRFSRARLLRDCDEEGQAYTIFSDSQAAVARIQHDGCGPAQALARTVIDMTYELRQRGTNVTV